ncbi:DUF3800 domain-containing protein [Ferrovum myxofaciens]|uniref:DUF3800 domain-containing protein n=1 Tax=Ferrovum myxofaciens TaxID=416213 RepID=UPI0004E0CA9F|nr:DUF3800 domain-containing protein [Ferrovum myxofaciens]
MEFDVNDMREMMIGAFQLRRVDDKFTFYYDETNNIRKFYLTDHGTNVVEHKNFVLGGIVLLEGQILPDIAPLHANLQMQSNATEIKFAHVAKGDFEQVLTSKRLAIVLSWIVEHGILIHYSSVNIIYWAIVDIIDSILAEEKFESYQPHHQPLKNELYRLANLDKPAFLALMKRHSYPDIQRGKAIDFIADINAFLEARSPSDGNLPALMLKNLIKKSASLHELAFLVDEEEDMLIESFQVFYTHPIMLFKNAIHIFDREIQIEKSLSGTKFKDGSHHVNFSFSDSKSEPGIQIADVVVGFLGKYQSFVEENSLPELMKRKSSWNENQISNFNLLRQLIDLSDDVSNAFIHRLTAMGSGWKNDTFMHDLRPMQHLI